MTRNARSTIVATTLAACLAAVVVAPAPALAENPLTFSATLGGCISGRVPAFSTVTVTWRDSSGHRKTKFTHGTDESGNWFVDDSTCVSQRAVKGDTIKAHVTAPSEATRTFTLKNVTGTFNRNTNVIAGKAPASGTLTLYLTRSAPANDGFGNQVCYGPMPLGQNGHYSYDTTGCTAGYDAIGGDLAFVSWMSPNGDEIGRSIRASYIDVHLGTAKVTGYLDPSGTSSLTLTSKTGKTRGSANATAGVFGAFKATIKKSGSPVNSRPNDVIRGPWAGTQNYKVPDLLIQYATGANGVDGICTPYTAYGLRVAWSDSSSFRGGVTDQNGYSGDFQPSGHQLATGDKVTFSCMRPNGDRTTSVVVIPA